MTTIEVFYRSTLDALLMVLSPALAITAFENIGMREQPSTFG
jgi:hypothetical protein